MNWSALPAGVSQNFWQILLSDTRMVRLVLAVLALVQAVLILRLNGLFSGPSEGFVCDLVTSKYFWGVPLLVHGSCRLGRILWPSKLQHKIFHFTDDYLICIIYSIKLAIITQITMSLPNETVVTPSAVAIAIVLFFTNVWLLTRGIQEVSARVKKPAFQEL